MFNSRVFVAELIGTFALVFIGAGAGIANAGLLGVAFAHGLTVIAFAYTFGYISGTHINPAVTFGLALTNTIKWGEAVFYWIAQFLGAVVAAFLLRTFVGDISAGATIGSLTNSMPILAALVEIVLTFFLVNAVLHNAVAGKSGGFAGLAIGSTLIASILVGGPLTGASLNPARTFGPALVLGAYLDPMMYAIYFAGPLLGSALAVGVFRFLNNTSAIPEETKTPLKKK